MSKDKVILKHFFSGYFHEDWQSDSGTTEDKELEARLFSDLGCYYVPSSEGYTATVWLERIAARLGATI